MLGAAGLLVELAALGKTCHVVDGPAVAPVEQHRRRSVKHAPRHRGQLLQRVAHLRHLPEHPGVVPAQVIHHRAVVLLVGAPSLAPLEILHRVRPAGHRLQAGQQVRPGPLQLVEGVPVHQAGGALHEHEGLLRLHAPHDRVVEGRGGGGGGKRLHIRVVHGVAVPGDHVQLPGQGVVVQPLVQAHEVGGGGGVRRNIPENLPLKADVVRHVPGGEFLPGQVQTHDAALAVLIGQLHLVEAGVGVAPESRPPGVVQLVNVVVIPHPQVVPEAVLAQVAAALAAQLVGNVPQDDPGVMAHGFPQAADDHLRPPPEGRGGQAVIVPHAVVVPHPCPGHPHALGVLRVQPGRARAGGGGQDGVNAVGIQAIHDLPQPIEMELVLPGLIGRPGEHA